MSIAAVIPVLFLIAGYGFMTCWNLSQWYTARQTGHRLYIRIALYGILTLIAASLVYVYLAPAEIHSFYQALAAHEQKDTDKPFDFTPYILLFIKIQLLAIGLAIAGGHLLTLMFMPWTNFFLKIALKEDDFELLMLRAMQKVMPVLLTCRNGKVYVGYVTKGVEPHLTRTDIKIMPILSGYRDIDTLRTTFTSNYFEIYNHLGIKPEGERTKGQPAALCHKDFEIVIPFREVQSTHLFDIDTYRAFAQYGKQ